MKKSLYFVVLFVIGVAILFVACDSKKEPTKEQRIIAEEMNHKLEIAAAGDVVLWKDNAYYLILGVDGMPVRKNTAILLQRTSCRSVAEWINLESTHGDIINVFLFEEDITAYVNALRKAVLRGD